MSQKRRSWHKRIKLFSTLSGMILLFWMSLHLNIRCTSSEKLYYSYTKIAIISLNTTLNYYCTHFLQNSQSALITNIYQRHYISTRTLVVTTTDNGPSERSTLKHFITKWHLSRTKRLVFWVKTRRPFSEARQHRTCRSIRRMIEAKSISQTASSLATAA